MIKRILFLLVIPFAAIFAEQEWTEVTYFERHDIKMRIQVYDPPVVME